MRFSSESIVQCGRKLTSSIPYLAIIAVQDSRCSYEWLAAAAQRRYLSKDPCTQLSEPILIPKLQINFADFPYLLCSKTTRGCSPKRPAADMGTIMGNIITNFAFQGQVGTHQTLQQTECCCCLHALPPNKLFQGDGIVIKKRQRLPRYPTASQQVFRCHNRTP